MSTPALKLSGCDADPKPASPPPAPVVPTQPAAPAAGPVAWITVEEAARRSGRNVGAVRRTAGDVWLSQGLARLQRPPEGGKARWMVSEAADPAFGRVKSVEQLTSAFDMRSLTEDQRRTLLLHEQILQDWIAARAGAVKLGFREAQITEQFLDRLVIERDIKLSRATLFGWQSAYRRSGRAGLVDARWTPPAQKQPADEFLSYLKGIYLRPNKFSKQKCYEYSCLRAQETGWEIVSIRTANRFLEALPAGLVEQMRNGSEAFQNNAQTYIERDYTNLASNEIWGADHHECDVWVRVGERLDPKTGEMKPVHARPWLTAWQDLASRKITGRLISTTDPNTESIVYAFGAAVKTHGVPVKVQVDNGKDFDSTALHGRTKKQKNLARRGKFVIDPARTNGVFVGLGIDARNVLPYHGQSKPIERFFRTFEDRFGRTWDTYCGSSPQTRPEGLQDRIDAGRAPTLEQFAAAFDEWLESDYHARPHDGQGMDGRTPAQVWEAKLITKITAPADLVDLLCLLPTAPVSVGQVGVTYKGLHYGQHEPALHALQNKGKCVVLRVDPADLSRLSVWTLEGKFVCVARANTFVPANATTDELRTAMKEKARDTRTRKEFHQSRMRMSEDLPSRMLMAAAAAHKSAVAATGGGDPGSPPPSMRPVQSPLADQLEAFQNAFDTSHLRPAVGAEGGSHPAGPAGSGAAKLAKLAHRLRSTNDE